MPEIQKGPAPFSKGTGAFGKGLVPDLDKWDAEAVAVRQRALAHLAIGAWPT